MLYGTHAASGARHLWEVHCTPDTVGVTSVPSVSLDTPPHSSSPPHRPISSSSSMTSSYAPGRRRAHHLHGISNPAPLSICSSPDRCVFSSWLSRFQHCNPEPSHWRLVIYPCISSRCPVTLCCLVCGLSPVSLMSVYLRLPNLPPSRTIPLLVESWSAGRLFNPLPIPRLLLSSLNPRLTNSLGTLLVLCVWLHSFGVVTASTVVV